MKKLLGIIVLGLFWCNISFADSYRVGQIIENEFRFNKKITFPLDPGAWEVIEIGHFLYGSIRINFVAMVLIKDNEIVAAREFQKGQMSSKYQTYLNTAVHNYFYMDKYDGCYKREEYTLIKKYYKGNTTNCLIVRHIDVNKALYNPDDPGMRIARRHYRRLMENRNIKVPNVMLESFHGYFSRVVSSNLYTVGYWDNPKYFNGPESKFFSEDSSEYHPSNIKKYPKFKKYMDNFINISATRHTYFEKAVSAKSYQKLDFTDIGIEIINIPKAKNLNNGDFIKQLNDLKKLLDNDVITEEEFTKAKNKILN